MTVSTSPCAASGKKCLARIVAEWTSHQEWIYAECKKHDCDDDGEAPYSPHRFDHFFQIFRIIAYFHIQTSLLFYKNYTMLSTIYQYFYYEKYVMQNSKKSCSNCLRTTEYDSVWIAFVCKCLITFVDWYTYILYIGWKSIPLAKLLSVNVFANSNFAASQRTLTKGAAM